MLFGPVVDPVLLGRVYDELLANSFPADELVSRTEFLTYPASTVEVVVELTGEDLLGAAVLTHHRDVTMLTYLVASASSRGLGTGGKLVAEATKLWRERGTSLFVAEVERPGRDHDPDFGDAERRLAFYDRHGALALDLPYFQPPVDQGQPRVPMLLILMAAVSAALNSTGDRVADSVGLHGLFEDTIGLPEAGDSAATALFAALTSPGAVKLYPLSEHHLVSP
ncbi:MAG TPA: hypothetical protein PLQ19_11300 [Aeromicrobium sp.]|nr:hypothetical protein [Aeromicrobium sp.]